MLLCNVNPTENNKVKLDHLESLVLKILVVNSNNIVSYEEFLSNWRSSEATANSLFRVISKLRGKLKLVGLTEKVIFNTPKKGYSLVATVELKNDYNLPSITKNSAVNYIKLRTMLYVVSFILISFMIIGFLYSQKSNEVVAIDTESISYFELLGNTEIKLELSSNRKNDLITYSTKGYDSKLWEIKIFDRFYDKTIIIEDKNNHLRKPTWISESQLVYRAYNEKYCKIRIATIDYTSQTYTANNLFSCNPESYSSSIAKLNESQILFTEAKLGSKASNLYIGDIKTGLIKFLDEDINNEGGLGIYNVITSPNSELIVLLSSIDGIKDKIRLVDPNNKWEVVWSEMLAMTNISVGWDGMSLSFRNNNGGISIVSFDKGKEIYRTHIPFIASIHNISSTNNGLIFTSGDFVAKNIVYTDLLTSQSIPITESLSAKNTLAHFYTENLILFVSNKTGLNQVMLYDLNNQISKQISTFKKNYKIINIASSSKYSKIALEFDNKTEIFDLLAEGVLSEESIKIDGVKPELFNDEFIFTRGFKSNASLYSFSLVTSSFNDLEIEGGYIAKSNGESLYYSKLYAPGVWLYQKGQKDKLILDLPSSAYKWYIDGNNIYYRNDLGEYSIFDISSGEISPFSSASCKVIINLKGGKCLSSKTSPTSNRVILLDW